MGTESHSTNEEKDIALQYVLLFPDFFSWPSNEEKKLEKESVIWPKQSLPLPSNIH